MEDSNPSQDGSDHSGPGWGTCSLSWDCLEHMPSWLGGCCEDKARDVREGGKRRAWCVTQVVISAWKSEEKTVRTLGREVGKALGRGVSSGLRGRPTSGE